MVLPTPTDFRLSRLGVNAFKKCWVASVNSHDHDSSCIVRLKSVMCSVQFVHVVYDYF